MRLRDIAGMAFQTVRQQKVRTALSCAGVIIGSLMLIASLAAREGIDHAVRRIFNMGDRMRRIEVFATSRIRDEQIPPDAVDVKGDMDDAKRERIRRMLIALWRLDRVRDGSGITPEKLAEIAAIEHVTEVIPGIQQPCRAEIEQLSAEALCMGAAPTNETLQERMVAGKCITERNEQGVLIHEFLAYQWGFSTPKELDALVGKRVNLKFGLPPRPLRSSMPSRAVLASQNAPPPSAANSGSGSTSRREGQAVAANGDNKPDFTPTIARGAVDSLPLPQGVRAALKTVLPSSNAPSGIVEVEFPILGVFRGASEEDDRLGRLLDLRGEATVLMPYQTATDVVLQMPGRRQRGFYDMTVIVDSENNLKEVQTKLQGMTFGARSLLDFVELLQAQVATVTWVLSALAGISLFVSALGITNTMVMSVVERTHEIGVMKAVGARDAHILLVFLCEGALIGLLGAALAVLIGWLATYPLDAWARSALDHRLHHKLGDAQVVFFPLWLAFAVPAFSAVVTTLAGIMPARRAARISPIVALRHE